MRYEGNARVKIWTRYTKVSNSIYVILQLEGAGVLWDTENHGDCKPPAQSVTLYS
jgi:hypothetical protein